MKMVILQNFKKNGRGKISAYFRVEHILIVINHDGSVIQEVTCHEIWTPPLLLAQLFEIF